MESQSTSLQDTTAIKADGLASKFKSLHTNFLFTDNTEKSNGLPKTDKNREENKSNLF